MIVVRRALPVAQFLLAVAHDTSFFFSPLVHIPRLLSERLLGLWHRYPALLSAARSIRPHCTARRYDSLNLGRSPPKSFIFSPPCYRTPPLLLIRDPHLPSLCTDIAFEAKVFPRLYQAVSVPNEFESSYLFKSRSFADPSPPRDPPTTSRPRPKHIRWFAACRQDVSFYSRTNSLLSPCLYVSVLR